MNVLSAFVEKTYFYPLNHLSSGDNGHVFFQARGNGFFPLIRNGDILHIQQIGGSALQIGGLALVQRPPGVFALRLILQKTPYDERPAVKTEGVVLNENEETITGERLFGRITAIDREGHTKRCDHRLARVSHVIYFGTRPLVMIFLFIRKILLLFHPKFFVRDPESSLRCVAEKYNDAQEVLHYAQWAFEGLDEEERLLVEQFMGRRRKVLNIGCGAGREAFALAEQGFEVVGIDVASGMIAEAKHHAQTFGKNVQFEVRSGTALDYPSNSFDCVLISAGVYSHIPTRQLRIDMLKKINDLLTPNGILFFSVLYRTGSFFSRISLYDAFRSIARPLLKKRLHSEPGDIIVRHVSPVGTSSKFCYLHLFKEGGEVLEELSSAGLDGFEDEKSSFWIVRPLEEANNQRTILHEVAG